MSQLSSTTNRNIKEFVVLNLICCAVGVFFTGLSLAYSSQYCMGGSGYGFPLAIFHPGHGDSVWAIQLQPELKIHSVEFDILFFLGNAILWHVVAIWPLIFFLATRRFRLKVVDKNCTAGLR